MDFVFGGSDRGTIRRALADLTKDSRSLSLAVSYIRMSGWRIFLELAKNISPEKIRIVCTNQLGVTDPNTVRDALAKKIKIRLYSGTNVFHSKLYLGEKEGPSHRFLIGSANLSDSALNNGVEVAVGGEDPGSCARWFDELFDKRSIEFSPQILDAMDSAFVARVKIKIIALPKIPKTQRNIVSEDIVESVFATLDDIALLNLDQAGNNVRNLKFALEVLQKGDLSDDKKRSEMNLLGFADSGKLTELGKKAAAAKDIDELARFWIEWLKNGNDETLGKIGRTGRLIRAKSAFASFWQLDQQAIDYFLSHAENPSPEQKRVCQIIELLANAGSVARALSLDQIKEMTAVFDDLEKIPDDAAKKIKSYLENKGARNWEVPDRPLLVQIWHDL